MVFNASRDPRGEMDKELGIYISAAPEMDAECELLGKLLAQLVTSARWTIRRTPRPHERTPLDLDALRAGQFYLILLGADVMAPMGTEWMAARDAKIATLAFRNVEVLCSPATAYFASYMDIPWQEYHSPTEFIRAFEQQIIRLLLEGTPGYGLDLGDVEQLARRLDALRQEKPDEQPSERRDASRGGVILSSP
jgi:hypothetical protein